MKILPYEQGFLDGLCGVYSILNVTRIINKRMSEKEAMSLFSQCMKHVEKRKSLGKVCTEGIVTSDVWSILKEIITVKYEITVQRPFREPKEVNIGDYFKELRRFFAQDGKRAAAIISIEGNGWDHWTVARAVTKDSVLLFDSAMMKRILISKCTFSRKFKRKILIIPHDTFYVFQKK